MKFMVEYPIQSQADGGQTLLLLNRRGFSPRVMCFDCGNAWRCQNCDIALVYHASDRRLRCHYCDYSIAPPDRCTHCGAEKAALLGIGTQRLEEEVRAHFPDSRIARLDRDTARRRGFTEGVLRRLRDRQNQQHHEHTLHHRASGSAQGRQSAPRDRRSA